MPNFFSVSPSGEVTSPYGQVLDAPQYAGQKQQLLQYFSTEAEMKAYLSDAGKVTAAMRDHIWRLSGGTVPGPAATTAGDAGIRPAPSVSAGAAGGR
jgi:hypothetical protein